MTTAVQHRRGTTAEHAAFTGLEGEVTIDTTKDTAVIHDGTLAGGYPLAKENLANVTTSGLSSIDGASTASDDKFFIFDQSATSLKTITRAELNNAIEQDALANVAITGGTINGTAIGGTTPAAGAFTTLSASGAATLSGLTASTALALDGSKNIVSVTNTGTGSNVLATSPTLVTPALGTPSALVGTNITGTATSFNINGTVGATTPASGAFTTLSASGAVTLSGGTANGVAYLNGSKVVTSGSALTFDGTTLAVNNGVTGGTALSLTGTYSGSGSVAFLNFQRAGGAVAGTLGYNDASTAIQFGTTTNHSTIFLQNNTEAMRLTSTGLGIGTSSPYTKEEIVGGKLQVSTAGGLGFAGGGGMNIYTGAGARLYFYDDSNSATIGSLKVGGTNALTFSAGGATEQLRLDSSGNLGLGVTPSAWTSGARVLQFPNTGSIGTEANGYLTSIVNARESSSNAWSYLLTGAGASKFKIDYGSFAWYTAPSGTAGNAITFTQALTLDSGGSLLIGDTSAPTNGLTSAALSTKGQGTGGSRRATASSMGVTSSLAQNATANTYSFGGYGGYGLFVAEGGDPNAAWRAAAIIWSTGAALTVLNLGSSNITVGSSGTTVTVQNTNASSQTISWSMLVLG